jgi:hypothetical protein
VSAPEVSQFIEYLKEFSSKNGESRSSTIGYVLSITYPLPRLYADVQCATVVSGVNMWLKRSMLTFAMLKVD